MNHSQIFYFLALLALFDVQADDISIEAFKKFGTAKNKTEEESIVI